MVFAVDVFEINGLLARNHLNFDALFYGHTHVKELYKSNQGKIICNVGSVTFPKAGNPPSFAVYEAGKIKLVKA